jgi:hypothetical protein
MAPFSKRKAVAAVVLAGALLAHPLPLLAAGDSALADKLDFTDRRGMHRSLRAVSSTNL